MPRKKVNTDTRYEVITQEDPETGDLILPIPTPVLEAMGWKEGDNLDFEVNENGTIFIKKANK
jgi:hypothetical protein